MKSIQCCLLLLYAITGEVRGEEPAIVFDNRPETGMPAEALAQMRAERPAKERESPQKLVDLTDGSIKTVRIRYFNKETWATEEQAREYVAAFLSDKSLVALDFPIWSQGVAMPEIECIVEFSDEHRKKLSAEGKGFSREGRLLIWMTESCFRDATGRWWFVSAFDHFHRFHPKGNRENAKGAKSK